LSTATSGAISIGIGGSGTTSTSVDFSGSAGGIAPAPAPTGKFNNPVVADVAPAVTVQPFGIKRDAFWPRSVAAWLVLSAILIVVSVQLVSPTRRWLPSRVRRPRRRTT
jgi:hypothetical protein